jgi:hypothetical protein
MTDGREERAASLRRIVRICQVLLVVIPVLALVLLLTDSGSPWIILPGLVLSEALLLSGTRGLRRSSLLQ